MMKNGVINKPYAAVRRFRANLNCRSKYGSGQQVYCRIVCSTAVPKPRSHLIIQINILLPSVCNENIKFISFLRFSKI